MNDSLINNLGYIKWHKLVVEGWLRLNVNSFLSSDNLTSVILNFWSGRYFLSDSKIETALDNMNKLFGDYAMEMYLLLLNIEDKENVDKFSKMEVFEHFILYLFLEEKCDISDMNAMEYPRGGMKYGPRRERKQFRFRTEHYKSCFVQANMNIDEMENLFKNNIKKCTETGSLLTRFVDGSAMDVIYDFKIYSFNTIEEIKPGELFRGEFYSKDKKINYVEQIKKHVSNLCHGSFLEIKQIFCVNIQHDFCEGKCSLWEVKKQYNYLIIWFEDTRIDQFQFLVWNLICKFEECDPSGED
eukprot:31562_1